MQPIFLIAGGPAVGKSASSRALAATFPRSVHIPVDTLRDMVISGLVLPGPVWPDELVLQIRLAREAAIGMARRYADEGFTVVIDDFIDPLGLREYAEMHAYPAFYRTLLRATQDEMHRRNEVRSPGEAGEYIHRAIEASRDVVDGFINDLPADGWLVLDTTAMPVDEVVAAIRSRAVPGAG